MSQELSQLKPLFLESVLDDMYGKKRIASSSSSGSGYKKRRTKAYSGKIPRAPAFSRKGQTAIIPLIYDHDFDLTADPSFAYQFTPQRILINGAAYTIPGSSQVGDVWELARIQKVEVTILPAAAGLDYNTQTLATGQTNIPYVYDAVDYNDPEGSIGLTTLRQNPSTKTHLLDHAIRRTIYPRMRTSNEVVDVGRNNTNLFTNAGVITTNSRWNGYVFYADMVNVAWTYGTCRISFKIFVECLNSK